MQFHRTTPILLLFILFLATIACKKSDDSEKLLITGDEGSVNDFTLIRPSEIPLTSENINNGFKWTTYSMVLDLDGDETFDIAIAYIQQSNINGDRNYYTSINRFNNDFEIMGRTGALFGNQTWAPTMLEKGERVELTNAQWGIANSSNYLSWQVIEAGVEISNYNLFPIPESDAYLIWRMTNTDNRLIYGWIHLNQTNANFRPEVLDIAFK